jgi:hypothetical protein
MSPYTSQKWAVGSSCKRRCLCILIMLSYLFIGRARSKLFRCCLLICTRVSKSVPKFGVRCPSAHPRSRLWGLLLRRRCSCTLKMLSYLFIGRASSKLFSVCLLSRTRVAKSVPKFGVRCPPTHPRSGLWGLLLNVVVCAPSKC